ncbi:MAG: right-handed parallel beta-helix repeat-containing protein [Planctomycetales bacterium]|nr:right-handed parallel beta-helix repeat-containing protein [Planctomycetales bacterium]
MNSTTTSTIAILLALSVSLPTFAGVPREFFVARDGNDLNPGTRESPFASCLAARNAIRKLRSEAESLDAGATVWIHGGTYEFAEPLVLNREDSGTGKAPIVFRAVDREHVQFSGSRRVSEFRPVTDTQVLERLGAESRDNVLVADLRASGVSDFGQVTASQQRIEVFFQDQPMRLARWPNEGFVNIVNVVGSTSFKSHGIPGTKEGWFTYDGERPSRWLNEPDGWLHGYWFWDWSDSYQQIESIDAAAKTIRLASPFHNYGYRNNQRYYALNLLAELDQPGEWYLDRQSGMLYFWPPATIERNSVAISMLPSLLDIEECEGIVFRDITFEGTRSTAIRIRNSQNCVIEDCTIRNTGSWGVSIQGGSGCMVQHSELYGLGEGGVSLSGGDRETLSPAGHTCLSNHIHDFGRLYRTYRPAVSIAGVGNRIAHNLIHQGPHNAIQLGGNEHVIEFNEIHHVCFETGDVGAFYMGRDWTQRGTIIRHNYFHDIQGPGLHGAMAVYLDDAASGMQIIGNVFLRAGRAAFIGGGRDNLVENNIFVDCEPSVHVDARGVGWMRDTITGLMPERLEAMPYRTSPWKDRYPQLLTLLADEPGKPKYNEVRHNVSWGGTWLNAEELPKSLTTFEGNLTDVDPAFVADVRAPDVTILDFQLRTDSPALKLDFKPIPVEKIGLLK